MPDLLDRQRDALMSADAAKLLAEAIRYRFNQHALVCDHTQMVSFADIAEGVIADLQAVGIGVVDSVREDVEKRRIVDGEYTAARDDGQPLVNGHRVPVVARTVRYGLWLPVDTESAVLLRDPIAHSPNDPDVRCVACGILATLSLAGQSKEGSR